MTVNTLKVLIIDDSAVIRSLLTEIINSSNLLTVIGTSSDPYDAREKIKSLNPDIITLDVEMPKMDGITFLRNLMRLRPMPVVIISSMTKKGSQATLDALEIGAIDYIEKPQISTTEELLKISDEIIQKITYAAKANITAIEHNHYLPPIQKAVINSHNKLQATDNAQLIAIGSSTGGVEAIKAVVSSLPSYMPPIVIVQHMPGNFTASFAKRLDTCTSLNVSELLGKEKTLENNCVYLANGYEHLSINKKGGIFTAHCHASKPVNRHRPAVDVLFNSMVEYANSKIVAILLTGMGFDGAEGMVNLKKQGALTIAQDEASSIVWGMPKAAIEREGASHILSLEKIPHFLTRLCYG